MKNAPICDYTGYDYETEFWKKTDRKYEHETETNTLRKLLTKHANNMDSVLDAGCGFGRLFETYHPFFNKFCLVDYAPNLIKQAKKRLSMYKNIEFINQSLYELDLGTKFDAIVSIRTLHHLSDTEQLIKNIKNHLNPNGILILDIPNYYHLKNQLRRKGYPKNAKIKISESYYNYDPRKIINQLDKNGLNVIETACVGLFRIPLLKKVVPSRWLSWIESIMNNLISNIYISPSVYIVARKTVDKSVDNQSIQLNSSRKNVEK